MNFIREELGEYLKANLTIRRVFALSAGMVCVGICIAVILGKMHLEIWQAALVLVLGLLLFEWAG